MGFETTPSAVTSHITNFPRLILTFLFPVMSVLAQRVLTAAVLIPLVVAAVLGLSNSLFASILAIIFLFAGLEWVHLAQFQDRLLRMWVPVILALLLAMGYLLHLRQEWMLIVCSIALVYWCVALVWVIQYERCEQVSTLDHSSVRFAAGMLTLAPAWIALVMLHEISPWLVMYILLLMWFADSAAYFAGRRFGQRKLAPKVSPGKSWEGVLGGLVAVTILAAVVALQIQMSWGNALGFITISVLVGMISVLGDLVESLFKRRAGLKDSGQLLPGHGGLLDRLDSLMSAAPGFALGWLLLESVN